MNKQFLNVRTADPADIDQLFGLWCQMQYPHVGYHPHYYRMAERDVVESATRKHILSMLDDANTVILVAEACDSIRGYCVASLQSRPPVFIPEMHLLIQQAVVAPNCRGTGVFSTLHAQILKWGASRGATHAEIMVDSKNPALHIYSTMGYSVVQHKMTLQLPAQQGAQPDAFGAG